MGENGGKNLYNFVSNNSNYFVDPLGNVVVLIHGVNTNAAWFDAAERGLSAYWNSVDEDSQEIIRFTWGNSKGKQGGRPEYATDSVSGMRTPGKDYMIKAVNRLGIVLNVLNNIKDDEGSCELISIVAHSQGTIITTAALQNGAEVDNFIAMGSPLDVLPFDEENDDLLRIRDQIRGQMYNYWSSGDEWAYFKGGIGANGDGVAKSEPHDWIINRHFGPGRSFDNYTLPSDKPFDEYDHSDYMRSSEFFENIHSIDVGVSHDTKISEHSKIGLLKTLGRSW